MKQRRIAHILFSSSVGLFSGARLWQTTPFSRTAKHYPCIKRAWIEFLGEPPGSAADRVDPVSS